MAELADAQASGACGSNIVWVQVPSSAFLSDFNSMGMIVSVEMAVSCGILLFYFFTLIGIMYPLENNYYLNCK